MIGENFKKIVDKDIEMCHLAIKDGDKKTRGQTYNMILSKYSPIISGFDEHLLTLRYDESGERCRSNLATMCQKLELFRAMNYENRYDMSSDERKILIQNNNQVAVNVNITFEEARNTVENMSSLQQEEIDAILEKIDELEKIINSKERKTKKWEQAKGIIKWVADKGVDVGIALLPLILKIGQ